MYFEGFLISVLTFLIIGLSLMTPSVLLSTVLGVLGASSLWSIKELYEQENRVKKGWFPANPSRKDKN